MPRVVITHAVRDRAHWASKHSERVAAFAPWGTNVVDHFHDENGNQVAVSVDVFDMAAMKKALDSPEIEAATVRGGSPNAVQILAKIFGIDASHPGPVTSATSTSRRQLLVV